MADDHDIRSIGQRIHDIRRREGISRADLAAVADRSTDWLKSVELGRRQLDRIGPLMAIADRLGVDLTELIGVAPRDDRSPRTGYDAVPQIRRSLLRHQLGQPTGHPRPLADLRLDAHTAHRHRQAARFGDLGALLPGLIDDASTAAAAHGGDERQQTHGLLSAVLCDTAMLVKRLGQIDLATVSARQAVDAAVAAGDPLLEIAAMWTQAEVCVSAGARVEGLGIVRAGLDRLDALLSDDDMPAWSLWGTMHLVAAVQAAQWSDRATVEDHIREATAAAERTGDRNDHGTCFGPANAALMELSSRLELGDGRAALEATQGVDLSALPTERRARHLIDVGRAHAQARDDAASMRALLDADRLAPEYVHSHAMVRDMVVTARRRDLLTSREPVHRMARRIGVS
ncbi:helix-turn-helix domain-containing protein [Embleya sp. NPDC059237]|uniref:helix-turn-helix domain-containing protein n=1 Tax=Embleya sp. NPDC059237 TaxID=3346784 RepID=UPI00369C2F76